jgi:hypothetical protein
MDVGYYLFDMKLGARVVTVRYHLLPLGEDAFIAKESNAHAQVYYIE